MKRNKIVFIIKLFAGYAPVKLGLDICFYSLKNILTTFNSVWLLQYISGQLLNASVSFGEMLKVLLLFLGINMSFDLLGSIYTEYLSPKLDICAKEKIEKEMISKARKLSLRCYEDTEFYNIVKQAKNCIDKTLFAVFSDVVQSVGLIVAMINTVIIVIGIDSGLLIFVLFVIPNLFIIKENGKWNAEKKMELAYTDRVKAYMQGTYLDKGFVRKFKTTNASFITEKYYASAYQEGRSVHKSYAKKLILGDMAINFFSLTFVYIACYGYGLFCLFYKDNFTVAEFSVVFFAVVNMLSRVNKLIKKYENISKLSVELSSLEKFESLEAEEIVGGGHLRPGEFKVLEFRDVSFSYRDRQVLKNVSFRIEAGSKVSIVGFNGAGKSTLIKLIHRFYLPDSGVILYNGVNVNEYDLDAYREKISAVFQDFNIFKLTLGQNISLNLEKDEVKAKQVLQKVGLNNCCDRLNSLMGRDFDTRGLELSGGMNQKTAIARALYKKHDILILDEPDAALDPIASEQIMAEVLKSSEKKTVIFISHHLSTTTMADKILMFENGVLTEQGIHDELMSKNGTYAEFFNCQAEMYLKKAGGMYETVS